MEQKIVKSEYSNEGCRLETKHFVDRQFNITILAVTFIYLGIYIANCY